MKFLKWSSPYSPAAAGVLLRVARSATVSKGCSMVQDDPDNPDAPIPGGTGPAFGD